MLVNKGIGGTSSGVYAACAEQMVGEVGVSGGGSQSCTRMSHSAAWHPLPELPCVAAIHCSEQCRAVTLLPAQGFLLALWASSITQHRENPPAPTTPTPSLFTRIHTPHTLFRSLQDPDLIIVEFTGEWAGHRRLAGSWRSAEVLAGCAAKQAGRQSGLPPVAALPPGLPRCLQ